MGENVKLGSKVKDRITGYSGTVSGRWESISGLVRFEVESLDKDGRIRTEWVDEARLEVQG